MEVKFIFANEDQGIRFMSWLCNGGEQTWWEHCDILDLPTERIQYDFDNHVVTFEEPRAEDN